LLPTIALVGRPNVGKSTLFNRLTKTRNALVHDFPGLTRDRHYGRARAGDREFLVVDTGGFEPVATSGILFEMARQARAAIAESDVIVFIVDAREGITPQDQARSVTCCMRTTRTLAGRLCICTHRIQARRCFGPV
jgi:GTPase